jgi:hypothetical protein
MTHSRAFALPLLASLAALPALAQERPEIFPTRDVAVTYRTSVEGQPAEMRMAWNAAQRLMRMEMPSGQGYLILDQQAGTGFMVMQPMRMIMETPAGQGEAARFAQASQTARFTREGSDRVANLPCTNWKIEDRGETGRVCITADGVTLRAQPGNGRGGLEALTVEFAAQDAARFVRPEGFRNVQIPGAAQASPAAAGAFPQRGSALPPPGILPPGVVPR